MCACLHIATCVLSIICSIIILRLVGWVLKTTTKLHMMLPSSKFHCWFWPTSVTARPGLSLARVLLPRWITMFRFVSTLEHYSDSTTDMDESAISLLWNPIGQAFDCASSFVSHVSIRLNTDAKNPTPHSRAADSKRSLRWYLRAYRLVFAYLAKCSNECE